MGLTYQQVRKYEGGQNRVSTGALLRIAEALGCTAVEIVAEVERALRPAGEIPSDGEAVEIARQIAALPVASRQSVVNIIGALSGAGVGYRAERAP
ncbi:helix-turn-helix domain-containing protein [Antarcticirhabdus aurantiaca]|uniref:helix-turn-helix domain-containing protein n=1 Tax=Antarcticirhabdus aurantiaca TaxID=2606717 RepID=UPI0034E2EDAE